jgi:hypothetical protein
MGLEETPGQEHDAAAFQSLAQSFSEFLSLACKQLDSWSIQQHIDPFILFSVLWPVAAMSFY